jgi:hypothetical protein
MATERLSMRKLREILRQKWTLRCSHRAVAASLQVSVGVVTSVLRRATLAGLDWAQVQALADDVLEVRLYGATDPGARGRPLPDCAYLHAERKKPGVTLELLHLEVPGAAPRRLRGHPLLRRLPRLARPPPPHHAPGAPGRREDLRGLHRPAAPLRRSPHGRPHRGRPFHWRPGRQQLHLCGGHRDPAAPRLARQPQLDVRLFWGRDHRRRDRFCSREQNRASVPHRVMWPQTHPGTLGAPTPCGEGT